MSKNTNQVCNNYAGCGHSISIFDPNTLSRIKVTGFRGYWHIVARKFYVGKNATYYLCEHDTYGDETACLIIDKDYNLVLADVWNGFSDLEEEMEWEKFQQEMFSVVKVCPLGTIPIENAGSQKSILYKVKFEGKEYDLILLDTHIGNVNNISFFYDHEIPINNKALEKALTEYYHNDQNKQ